jgi:hypothetical protein
MKKLKVRRNKMKVLGILGIIILIAGALALGVWVTMLLWNYVMPSIFGLTKIGFWKSAGVLALSFLLFRNVPTGNKK